MLNSQGGVLLVKGGPIGRSDANQVELASLLEGLCMLKTKDFRECIVGGCIILFARLETLLWTLRLFCNMFHGLKICLLISWRNGV